MSTLAERLWNLERDNHPHAFGVALADIWPEVCAVVEAIEQPRGCLLCGMYSVPNGHHYANCPIQALARRMDEEGL